jgi:hypothetical protein
MISLIVAYLKDGTMNQVRTLRDAPGAMLSGGGCFVDFSDPSTTITYDEWTKACREYAGKGTRRSAFQWAVDAIKPKPDPLTFKLDKDHPISDWRRRG